MSEHLKVDINAEHANFSSRDSRSTGQYPQSSSHGYGLTPNYISSDMGTLETFAIKRKAEEETNTPRDSKRLKFSLGGSGSSATAPTMAPSNMQLYPVNVSSPVPSHAYLGSSPYSHPSSYPSSNQSYPSPTYPHYSHSKSYTAISPGAGYTSSPTYSNPRVNPPASYSNNSLVHSTAGPYSTAPTYTLTASSYTPPHSAPLHRSYSPLNSSSSSRYSFERDAESYPKAPLDGRPAVYTKVSILSEIDDVEAQLAHINQQLKANVPAGVNATTSPSTSPLTASAPQTIQAPISAAAPAANPKSKIVGRPTNANSSLKKDLNANSSIKKDFIPPLPAKQWTRGPRVRQSSGGRSEQTFVLAQKIIAELMVHPHAHPFLVPVDPEKLGIPNYFYVIKHPMDLGTVRKRLTQSFYSRIEAFIADVRLIWDNAKTFNLEESDVYIMAQNLSDVFEESVPKLIEASNTSPRTQLIRLREELATCQQEYDQLVKNDAELTRMLEETSISQSCDRSPPIPSIPPAPAPLTYPERLALYRDINGLSQDFQNGLISIFQQHGFVPSSASGVVEIQFESLDDSILKQLQTYIGHCLSTSSGESRGMASNYSSAYTSASYGSTPSVSANFYGSASIYSLHSTALSSTVPMSYPLSNASSIHQQQRRPSLSTQQTLTSPQHVNYTSSALLSSPLASLPPRSQYDLLSLVDESSASESSPDGYDLGGTSQVF